MRNSSSFKGATVINIFQRLFKGKEAPQKAQRAELISGSAARFTAWNGSAYASDIFRGGVDSIARNAAKLKASHVTKRADYVTTADDRLNRLLQVQPNPHMSAFDMQYKLVTAYYLHNNAFLWLEKNERGDLVGIYPINAITVEFLADPMGAVYCRFHFKNGKRVTLPYAEIIHLRRHFNADDLLGDNNSALTPALTLAHTQNEGAMNAIKSSARIRGLLKFTQLLAPEKLREERDRFTSEYLSAENSGGIVVSDPKTEYTPIVTNPVLVDEGQVRAVQNKIYDYLGISEAIVNSSYSEDQWAAFYESVIEPLAVQMSLEFTRKIFTDREQAFGNSIVFESGRLQFSSNTTKIRLIAQLMPFGLLTVNQALEILNLPTVPDGEKRLQTLNVVDAAKANQYQLEEVQ